MLNSFLSQHIRTLLHELNRLSGNQFRSECILFPEEDLGIEKRITLFALVHGKVSVVNSLSELATDFHSVEQYLLYNQQIPPGFEQVAIKYNELLSQRWVIAADKYKRGYDPNPNADFRTYAYGLLQVDQLLLDDLRRLTQEAEKPITGHSLDTISQEITGFKNLVERQTYRDIFVNGKPQENIARSLLQTYLTPRSYREVKVRGGQTDLLIFEKSGRYLFEAKIWRGQEDFEQGIREIEEYIVGEGDDLNLKEVFYVIFDPTKSQSSRQHLGNDFAVHEVHNHQIRIILISLAPPLPSKKQ